MFSKKEISFYKGSHRTIASGEDFIYLLPHAALQKWISNYTITFPNNFPGNYSIIPHGSATLVFSTNNGEVSGNLFGPITRVCQVGSKPNLSEMLFIIEFQPAGLYAFTGISQSEIVDGIFPFALMNTILNRLIVEALMRASTINNLITEVEKILLTYSHKEQPGELNIAVHSIIDTMGNIRNKELSITTNYSERHLNRIFNQYLGMNIKSFSQLVRINKAIRILRDQQNSIMNVGSFVGFYDLPHFIHDFKSTCDITPQEYVKNMSVFYNEIAKF